MIYKLTNPEPYEWTDFYDCICRLDSNCHNDNFPE